jgi:protein associated with RNAse G/E
LLNWYVNLQTPLVRTAIGFDYLDQELDIVISPDLKTWRWKDEDRLADAVARGRIPPERVAQLRDEGLRVIDQLNRAGSVFHQGWDRWLSPWSEPAMPPAGWDRVDGK